jgi:acetyl esterase/lipase
MPIENRAMPLEAVTVLPSPMRPLLRALLRYVARPLLGRLSVRGQRLLLNALTLVQRVPRGVTMAPIWMLGVPAERLRDARRRRERAILYVHGGAYCTLGPRSFRAFAARLARGAAADVYVIDYRLAPEHPYPAALDDALDAYRWLLREGYAAENLSIVGDSAGGGLALAALMRLRDTGAALPASATLISPWTDLTLGGASIDGLARRDPLLTRAWLERSARAYAGPSLHDAGLAGLPPMLVIVASDEILLGDAELLVARATRDGTPAFGRRYDGLWHDFPLQAGLLPEAELAIDDIVAFVRRRPEPADYSFEAGSKSSAREFMQ